MSGESHASHRPSSGESSLRETRTFADTSDMPGRQSPREQGTPFGSRYVLLSKIGKGGMGEVWKARDLELDQYVALKMIRPDLLEQPDVLERFKREITVARKVTHRNVTRIYDLGEVEGTRFISMEYLEGLNLKEFIRQEGALPEEKAIPILKAICEGLKAAHDSGVVHRDLKPHNIFIDREGRPQIMDFGIAFSVESSGLTRTGALLGTPEYMSPEQVRGETIDARSDIYSLGLILYEMLTADLPFGADTSAGSMYRRLSEKPRRPRELRSDLSPYLETIILRCLERERAFRYADVGGLLADLEAKHARGVTGRRLAARLRSRGALVTATVAAVVLMIGGLAFFVGRAPGAGGAGAGATIPGIAILPFENGTGASEHDWIRSGLPALIENDLGVARKIRLLDGARVHKVLDDLEIPLEGRYGPLELKRVAAVLGADVLITGVLSRAGDRLLAEARVRRPGAGDPQEVAFVRVEGEGENAIFDMADDLTLGIAGALSIETEVADATLTVTTSSLQAMRLYAEGLEASRAGRETEAASRLESAVRVDPGFTIVHALLAEVYDRLGDEERAMAASERALAGIVNLHDPDARSLRARHALLAGRTEEAIAEYAATVEVYPELAVPRFELAALLEQTGDIAGAGLHLQRAVAVDPQNTLARYALGRVRMKQGDVETALGIFSELLGTYTQASDDRGRGDVLLALGHVQFDAGRLDDALDYYRQSGELRSRIDDQSGIAVALSNSANVLRMQGKNDEAIRTSRAALEMRIGLGDEKGIALSWVRIGEIHEDAGQFDSARKAYQDALKAARRVKDPALLARISGNLAYVSSVLGDYGEAYLFYEDTLEKSRDIGNKSDILGSLVDLGLIEQWHGRYDEAIGYDREALQIARETGEKVVGVTASINLATIHAERGEYAAAIELLTEAVTGAREMEHQYLLAWALLVLGSSMTAIGDLDEAGRRLEEAERIVDEIESAALIPEVLIRRGEIECARGRIEECLEDLKEAVLRAGNLKDRRLMILSRLTLGAQSLRAGRSSGRTDLEWAAAEAETSDLAPLQVRALAALAAASGASIPSAAEIEAARSALRPGRSLNIRESLIEAHGVLGRAAASGGDLEGARRHFSEVDRLVREMADGLEKGPRATLMKRTDLSRLIRDAFPYLGAGKGDGTAEGSFGQP